MTQWTERLTADGETPVHAGQPVVAAAAAAVAAAHGQLRRYPAAAATKPGTAD
jgi:hypothetical protein